jgi:hypothetical protein
LGVDIVPDAKDWTWVLERRCEECGFDASTFDVSTTGLVVRRFTDAWVGALAGENVAQRTRPDRWSTLEYACHVRDVLRIYDGRLERMLTEDGPHYENWDQDAAAIADDYGSQQPAAVARDFQEWGLRIADRFDTVHGDAWARTGFRSDGAAFTIESFARYFVHDPIHHLWDVGIVAT